MNKNNGINSKVTMYLVTSVASKFILKLNWMVIAIENVNVIKIVTNYHNSVSIVRTSI